jgi:hypothetical protein
MQTKESINKVLDNKDLYVVKNEKDNIVLDELGLIKVMNDQNIDTKNYENINKMSDMIYDNLKVTYKNKEIKISSETTATIISEVSTNHPELSNSLYKMNQNKITNAINYSMSSSEHVDFQTGKVTFGNLSYTIQGFELIKENITDTTSKLFCYSLLNLKGNIFECKLKEFMEFRGVNSWAKAQKRAVIDIGILDKISNIAYIKKEQDIFTYDKLIIHTSYNAGTIRIEYNPKFVNNLRTYAYYHQDLFKLSGNSYFLAHYFYTHARINRTTTFYLSIESCLKRTKLPSVEAVKTIYSRNYSKKIIEPFTEIIDSLTEKIPCLYITYEKDYMNIREFIDGKIKITITNKIIVDYHNVVDLEKRKKSIKKNKENKESRKKLAIELYNKDTTIKEIAKKLNLTTKTIKNYLKEENL